MDEEVAEKVLSNTFLSFLSACGRQAKAGIQGFL